MNDYLALFLASVVLMAQLLPQIGVAQSEAATLQESGPLVIDGQTNQVYENLRITSATGNCVTITNSENITIRASEIGPCGTHLGAIHHHGIRVEESSNNIKIFDSYIHPEYRSSTCCDSGNGVFVTDSTTIHIQGNVIAYGESNIEAFGVTDLDIIGNFLLNPRGDFPRGQNVQAWYGNSDVLVKGNYALASGDSKYLYPPDQEDSLNFGDSNKIIVRDNYVRGGKSPSGCGILADYGAHNAQFINNTIVDTGNCGIGITSGSNPIVDTNRVLNRKPIPGGGNVAIYVWDQYYPEPCGPTKVSNNIASELQPDGVTESGFWDGGGCEPVTLSNNIWDQEARDILEPIDVTNPAPLIPPRPLACVAPSPYSTQTNQPPCVDGDDPPRGPVASYNFNEGTGTLVNDRSGTGNNGTRVGATWTTGGKYARALSFDGVNDYVSVPDSSSLDIAGELTISAWVRKSSNSGYDTIVAKGNGTTGPENYYLDTFGDEPELGFATAANVWHGYRTLVSNLVINQWRHVAMTYNDAANTIVLYVGGVQQSAATVNGSPLTSSLVTNNGGLRIGYALFNSEAFHGRIDDLRIYNRALSAGEITTDMNTPISD